MGLQSAVRLWLTTLLDDRLKHPRYLVAKRESDGDGTDHCCPACKVQRTVVIRFSYRICTHPDDP
jgi:hypothetical protein